MGHVSSTPVHGQVKTRAKKRFIRLLSPDALSAKRRKLIELASGRHFEEVTVYTSTTRDLGKEQSGAGPSSEAQELTVSSTPMDALTLSRLRCFYVAYAYIGHELGYPAMPFIMEKTSTVFWKRTLDITKRMSGEMLQINEDPQFFADIFTALQNGTDH
ncbi:hypothetical protein SRHO_G00186500 [Serrasalmus rhombeus]